MAISTAAVGCGERLINIENPGCTMLIGAIVVDTWYRRLPRGFAPRNDEGCGYLVPFRRKCINFDRPYRGTVITVPYSPNSIRRAENSDQSRGPNGVIQPPARQNELSPGTAPTKKPRLPLQPDHTSSARLPTSRMFDSLGPGPARFIDCLRENPNCALPGLEIYDMMHTTRKKPKQEVFHIYGPQSQRSEPE